MKKNTRLFIFVILLTFGNTILANTNALRLKISGNNFTDETIIRLLSVATESFDGNYDAWKLFSPNASVPSIYTQIAPGQELSINALPEYTSDKSIILYTNIPATGNYTLTVEEIFPITPNYKISITNLNDNQHYVIQSDTSFTFIFQPQQQTATFQLNISLAPTVFTQDESCHLAHDGVISIVKQGNQQWDYEIKDQLLTTIDAGTSHSDTMTIQQLAAGNYTIITNANGISDTINATLATPQPIIANFEIDKDTVYVNENTIVNTTNLSQNAMDYLWDFGDGFLSYNINESHQYLDTGVYEVKLTALRNQCLDSIIKEVVVLNNLGTPTSISEMNSDKIQFLTKGNGLFEISNTSAFESLQIISLNGKLIYEKSINNNNHTINFNGNARGVYVLILKTRHQQYYKKKLVY